MTIAGLTSTQMYDILRANGYEVLSDKHRDTEGIERIIVWKNGHSFTLRVNRFIRFSEVVKRCLMLDIKIIPEDIKEEYDWCVHAYELQMAQLAEMDGEDESGKSDTTDKEKEDDPKDE